MVDDVLHNHPPHHHRRAYIFAKVQQFCSAKLGRVGRP